jgi:hypothetical protein
MVVLPCPPSAHAARNVRHHKVRKLLGRLKEYLHQTYCQQDKYWGKARRSKGG